MGVVRDELARLDRPAWVGFVIVVALLSSGCGATGPASQSQSHATAQAAQVPVTPGATLADLRNRPLVGPAAGSSCPITQSHDLNPPPQVGGAKGKGPGFAFGPGPAYLSGIVQLYPGAFDNEVWLIEPKYTGPLLIRGGQANGAQPIAFQQPITFGADSGFSNPGSPPPGQPVTSVTIDGTPIPFYQELDLPAAATTDPPGYWRMFFARSHIDVPGCYAFQLDGLTFAVVIVFQVPDAARPGG